MTGGTGGGVTAGQLQSHLAACYGIAISGLTELDTGVFRVARPDWVARLFPAAAGNRSSGHSRRSGTLPLKRPADG